MEQLYTLGDVNFDSVIIIDFGNNLKSVLTSLVYADVNQNKVLFTTINQWFDESIFYENTIKNLYYPSVNYKEFKKYNNKYFKKFNIYPNEITILAYDALGLIYYAWKKNNEISSINDFLFKSKIKGKIGTFSFKDRIVSVEGRLKGTISFKLLGKKGFGYDPIFIPLNKKITFGQMSKSKKIKMDHRFIAFKKLRKKIKIL